MRLDKLLSSLGYGTRKDIEYYARRGFITYKDEILRDASKKVEHSLVKFDGEELDPPQGIIIAMNKPKGIFVHMKIMVGLYIHFLVIGSIIVIQNLAQ